MALGTERREASKAPFEAVLEIASENEEAVIVHGWIRNDGRWLAHAWCEFDELLVVDLTSEPSRVGRADYYEAFGVSEDHLIRYSRLEYFTLVAEQGHFGPFDAALFAENETTEQPPKRG